MTMALLPLSLRAACLMRTCAPTLLLALAGCMPPGPRGVSAWVASSDVDVAVDAPLQSENALFSAARQQVRLAAAAGETVSFQLVLRGGWAAAGRYDVLIDEFAGEGGSFLPARAVERSRIVAVEMPSPGSWFPSHTGRSVEAAMVPDMVVPWDAPRGGPVPLNEPGNHLVWVDIRVPHDAIAGAYRAMLRVRPAGESAASAAPPTFACEVLLEVQPFAIPIARSVPIVCRVDPRALLSAGFSWPQQPAEKTRLLPDEVRHADAIALVHETMRLFQSHRCNPILWASFPTYRPLDERTLELDWAAYDALVTSWLDGSAFDDGSALDVWAAPVSLAHPDADQHGGLETADFAAQLGSYLRACEEHFEERGWLDRAVLRLAPPGELTPEYVARIARTALIVRQSETLMPLIAHLPPRSLRGLGWQSAAAIELEGVSIWAPPASWAEPVELRREQDEGARAWLLPAMPPFSGSLAIGAPPNDVRTLPWIAHRYGMDGLWIENAAAPAGARATPQQPWRDAPLVYSGAAVGLPGRPLASLRLKRLLRGAQDVELLGLLEASGGKLLASRIAEQVVRWGLTDACVENIVSTLPAGWPGRAATLDLARRLVLAELAARTQDAGEAHETLNAVRTEWELLLNPAQRVHVQLDGVRLVQSSATTEAVAFLKVVNTTSAAATGRVSIASAPLRWTAPEPSEMEIPARARRIARLPIAIGELLANIDGSYPLQARWESDELGLLSVNGKLAAAACPMVQAPLRIDGRLDDWPLASDNAAGDFRLVGTAEASFGEATADGMPALPTTAMFCRDDENLYVAIRSELVRGEAPLWSADNSIPIEGAMPWGQECVEVLIDPRPEPLGGAADLYCLQIKPSGLVAAYRGCRTEPPIGAVQAWPVRARAAVDLVAEAWVVELAIPLDGFGAAARQTPIWGMNIARLDSRRGEYASWSGARGHVYRPESLGNLVMGWRSADGGE